MLKNKIVTVGLAGMLSMSLGLAACGNQSANTAQPAAETKTETTAESATNTLATAAEASKILYWQGTLADGQTVFYTADNTDSTALLAIIKPDVSDAKGWAGKATISDTKVTITDDTTSEKINITVLSAADDYSSLKVNIEGYGEVEMKPTTAGEFATQIEGIVTGATAAAVTSAATEAANELSKAVMYWEGTLADGSTVDYVANPESKEALIAITKSDLSDIKSWYGKVTVDGDKSTITDTETKQTISFTGASAVTDTATSAKLNIDGYGEVTLKPVTGGQLASDVSKLADQVAAAVK